MRKAQRYKVRLKVEDWKMSAGHAGLMVRLDQHSPKRVHQTIVQLGSLVDEGTELQAGEHRLVVFAVRASGVSVKPRAPSTRGPFATVHFFIGGKSPSKIKSTDPLVVHHLPRGTLNGVAAADAAVLDFYLLNAKLGPGKQGLTLTLRGPDGRAERVEKLTSWRARALTGLVSGDHDFELVLTGPDGKPLGSPGSTARRTITVNRDAPVAKAATE